MRTRKLVALGLTSGLALASAGCIENSPAVISAQQIKSLEHPTIPNAVHGVVSAIVEIDSPAASNAYGVEYRIGTGELVSAIGNNGVKHTVVLTAAHVIAASGTDCKQNSTFYLGQYGEELNSKATAETNAPAVEDPNSSAYALAYDNEQDAAVVLPDSLQGVRGKPLTLQDSVNVTPGTPVFAIGLGERNGEYQSVASPNIYEGIALGTVDNKIAYLALNSSPYTQMQHGDSGGALVDASGLPYAIDTSVDDSPDGTPIPFTEAQISKMFNVSFSSPSTETFSIDYAQIVTTTILQSLDQSLVTCR